jgi:hypothetical protein
MKANRLLAPLLVAGLTLPGAAVVARQEQTEEDEKKKDKDSIELVVTGCLKGRALQAEEVRPAKEDDLTVIQARTFRVNGARDVMDELKKQNNRYVEAKGRVKRSSLAAIGPGIDVGGARITVTPGTMGNPSRAPQHNPNAGVLHIDVTAVRVVSENCSSK